MFRFFPAMVGITVLSFSATALAFTAKQQQGLLPMAEENEAQAAEEKPAQAEDEKPNIDQDGFVNKETQGTKYKYQPKTGETWLFLKEEWKKVKDEKPIPESDYEIKLFVSPSSGMSMIRTDKKSSREWTFHTMTFQWLESKDFFE